MTFTVTEITRCTGTNHFTVSIDVGGTVFSETFLREDFELEPTVAARKEAVITRLRSARKELLGPNPTFAQIQAALVGQTFKV